MASEVCRPECILPARHTHAHVTKKARLRRAAGGCACDATHFDEARQQRERVRPRHGDRRGGVAPVERRAARGPRVSADRNPDTVLEQQQLSGAEGRDHRRARPPRREQLRQRARACVDGRVSACTLCWSVGFSNFTKRRHCLCRTIAVFDQKQLAAARRE